MKVLAIARQIAQRPHVGPMAVAALLFGSLFLPFFSALALAAIFALALFPLHESLRSRMKFVGGGACSALLLAALSVLLGVPMVWILVDLVYKVVDSRQTWLAKIQHLSSAEVLSSLPKIRGLDWMRLQEHVHPFLQKTGSWALGLLTTFATQIPVIALHFVVFIGALYLFLSRADGIRHALAQSGFIKAETLTRQIKIWKEASYQSVVVNAMIAAMQASIIALGAYFLTEISPWHVFIGTFFFSFVPVLGAATMGFSVAVVTYIAGHTGAAWGMVAVSLFAGGADNVVWPLVVSKAGSDNVHPLVALVAFIGGMQVFGFSGLFIGPVLLAAAPAIYHSATKAPPDLMEKNHDTTVSTAIASV